MKELQKNIYYQNEKYSKKICEDKIIELEETKRRCSYKTLEKLISPKLEKRDFKEKLVFSQKMKKIL